MDGVYSVESCDLPDSFFIVGVLDKEILREISRSYGLTGRQHQVSMGVASGLERRENFE